MTFFSVPSNLLATSALIGLLLVLLRVRLATIVSGLSLGAIATATLSPLGNVLLTPLDQRFPAAVYPADLQGIIVLGGSYDRTRNSDVSTIVLEDDTEPLALVPHLAQRYPEAKIIYSGGNNFIASPDSDFDFVKPYLASLGVAPERIIVEDQSRSTAENAQFSAQLLSPSPSSRWLLVTFGHRMPRAVGAFRKAGFNVFAFPTGLRTKNWSNMWSSERTAADNLRHLDIAVHEWLALAYYKLRGFSDEWFAGPLAAEGCIGSCVNAQNAPP